MQPYYTRKKRLLKKENIIVVDEISDMRIGDMHIVGRASWPFP
jgi:hypothetical protein